MGLAANITSSRTPARDMSWQISNPALAGLLAIYWLPIMAFSVWSVWDIILDEPILLWRPLVTDATGIFLCLVTGINLRQSRHHTIPIRLLLCTITIIVVTLVYSIVTLVTQIPLYPGAQHPDVHIQLGQMLILNGGIFLGWAIITHVLDTRLDPARNGAARWTRFLRSRTQPAAIFSDNLHPGVHPPETIQTTSGITLRAFLTFQAVYWIALTLLDLTSLFNTGDPANYWRVILLEIAGFLFTTFAYLGLLRFLDFSSLAQRALTAFALAIILTCLYLFADFMIDIRLFPIEAFNPLGERIYLDWPYLGNVSAFWIFVKLQVFIGWGGFYLALDLTQRIRAQERQLYRSSVLAKEAQLKMLRFQLNPHFLFNTLNAVSSLVLDNRNEEAESMLIRMSRFLRFALEATPGDRVSLRQELDAQELYLGIEKARFADRLEMTFDIEPETENARVPSLILQPLMENCIKYGVSPSTQTVHINIQARRENSELVIDVIDDGPGNDAEIDGGTGLGLRNIRSRLEVIYGHRAHMVAGPGEAGGYAVQLRMPFEVKPHKSFTPDATGGINENPSG
jgi:two-component system LytT family sensor kinase